MDEFPTNEQGPSQSMLGSSLDEPIFSLYMAVSNTQA